MSNDGLPRLRARADADSCLLQWYTAEDSWADQTKHAALPDTNNKDKLPGIYFRILCARLTETRGQEAGACTVCYPPVETLSGCPLFCTMSLLVVELTDAATSLVTTQTSLHSLFLPPSPLMVLG